MSKKAVPDKETLQAAIKSEMESIIGKSGDTLSEARARLMDAYLGNPGMATRGAAGRAEPGGRGSSRA